MSAYSRRARYAYSGANFVKTSTGYGKRGATVEDVKLLREVVGSKVGVKASGGIGTYDDALKMINAGASRLGSSSGVRIVETTPNSAQSIEQSLISNRKKLF